MFEEFCVWYTKKHEPSRDIATSADKFKATRTRSKKKAGARKNGRVSAAEHDDMPDFDSKKFDALEKQFMAVLVDDAKLDQMWDRLDFNGNQLVSLAEIDKLVVERYPLLNNKPALMRAYKQTTLKDGGDGDAWVEPKEFPQLLSNLFYFNKLFQAFTGLDTDNDRRLDFTEFKQGLDTLGMTIDEKEAHAAIKTIEKDVPRTDRKGNYFWYVKESVIDARASLPWICVRVLAPGLRLPRAFLFHMPLGDIGRGCYAHGAAVPLCLQRRPPGAPGLAPRHPDHVRRVPSHG